jgi:hypothetical protein
LTLAAYDDDLRTLLLNETSRLVGIAPHRLSVTRSEEVRPTADTQNPRTCDPA